MLSFSVRFCYGCNHTDNVLSDESLQFDSANSDVCRYTNDDASESKNSMLLVKVYIESSLIENYEFGAAIDFVDSLLTGAEWALNQMEEAKNEILRAWRRA